MRIFLLGLIFFPLFFSAQVVDRYNFIQKPTENGVTIAWRTASSVVGTLKWGSDPFNLVNIESNSVATKKHVYDLTSLTPNTKYFYQTSTDNGVTSGIDHFYTSKTDSTRNISFLHYGDCGYNNSVQSDIAALMIADSAEFGIVAGDVDQGTGDNYDEIFFGPYTDLLKNTCQYTCIGNHDTYADNAATYIDAFYLPSNNPQNTERYYSFAWGNAKFVCLDSNIPYTIGSDQHNWMLDELKCNDRQWLFVFFHHPPWTNAWSADYFLPFSPYFLYQGSEDMRTDLVPYFETYNVDFVLNGHSHCYQRGELNGVKYIISGGAGSSSIDFNTNSNAPNIDTELYVNQYVRFDVKGDTATYVSIDINDNVIDSVSTIKNFVNIRPILSLNGSVLESSIGNSYTWFLDGIQITGETNQNFTPISNGVYEVMTTNQYGCTFMSNPFQYTGTPTLITENNLLELSVFPNPSKNTLNIVGELGDNESTLSIRIFNSLGEILISSSLEIESAVNSQIELSVLSSGIYFLELSTGKERILKQVIKE